MKYLLNTIKTCLILVLSTILLGSICKKPFRSTKEARGLWVTRWEWAIQNDTDYVASQQQRIVEIFKKAKDAKMNFVVFQIRGNGDAFYHSQYEPWSNLLTGTVGKDPGWDPLRYALEQARICGLELHVWFNTFPAWRGTEPPPHTKPEQVYNAHPEWIICDSNGKPMKLNEHYVNLSPGIPAVRHYIHNVAMDIVKNYDIDGFHFDYIRYPEGANKIGYSHDAVSVKLFNSPEGNPGNLGWEDWQRENTNIFVRKFYDEATALKPWLKISAAVIGKYDYSNWNGFHIVFQDAKKWLSEGKMDFIAPMIYWQTDHPTAPFRKIVKDWLKNFIHDRYIFPGMMVNRLGSKKWPLKEVIKQISYNRDLNNNGFLFFSYAGLLKAEKELEKKDFQHLANFPPMSWKDNKPPMDPGNLKVSFKQPTEVQLEWNAPDSTLEPTDIYRYNIYRSQKSTVDFMDARNLIHITATPDTVFYDSTVESGQTYYYIVTALDRVNNESPPSAVLKVVVPQFVMVDSLKYFSAD